MLDGETTLGEYWEQNPRSHCHDMMGHIIEWYYNGIAGILPQEPGFDKVLIRPYLPKGMTQFSCSYRSVRGHISVEVRQDDAGSVVTVTVPDRIVCEVDPSQIQERNTNVKVQRIVH